MAGFVNTDFEFNGVSSTPYEVKLVRINESGLIGTPISGGKNINEEYVNYRDKPWFYSANMQPMDLKMGFTIISATPWTDSVKQNVFDWLFSPRTYCDFKSNDNYDSQTATYSKVYKLMFTSPPQFYTADLVSGYLELDAKAYPFAYTEVTTQTETISSSPTQVTIVNSTNVRNHDNTYYYYPKMYVDLTGGATSFKIINTSDSNRVFELTGLDTSEQLYIDNELKVINTSSAGENRIADLTNKQWFRLVQGTNVLQIYGTSSVRFEYQFPIMI